MLSLSRALLMALAVVIPSYGVPLYAQTGSGAITGIVRDQGDRKSTRLNSSH